MHGSRRGTRVRLGDRSARRHPPDALLHAYVAGELDPANRSAIASHLDACDRCRAAERKVGALRGLIASAPPPGIDELRWRRIAQNVMTQLEDDARSTHQLSGDLFPE